METEYQARRAKAREIYPVPLRSLFEARQTPDDSDLGVYKRALNEVRRNPQPELFEQMAEFLEEGTCEVQGMLRNILFDDFLKLEKWDETKRLIALRALVNALPRAKSKLTLEHLIEFILQAEGGGRLKVTLSETVYMDVEASRTENGRSSSFISRSSSISSEQISRAAELCREALKNQYPELK